METELNPFEKSFAAAAGPLKTALNVTLPPLADLSKVEPTRPLLESTPVGDGWDSLKTGPLSSSLLKRPTGQTPAAVLQVSDRISPMTAALLAAAAQESGIIISEASRKRSETMTSQESCETKKSQKCSIDSQGPADSQKRKSGRCAVPEECTEEEKRKNFLERNRQAALKCRQRKKEYIQNLQTRVDFLTEENQRLEKELLSLREESVNLRTLLLAHVDCPMARTSFSYSSKDSGSHLASPISTGFSEIHQSPTTAGNGVLILPKPSTAGFSQNR